MTSLQILAMSAGSINRFPSRRLHVLCTGVGFVPNPILVRS